MARAGTSIVHSVSPEKEPFKNIELVTHTIHLTVTFSAQTGSGPDPCPEGNGVDYEARARNKRRRTRRAAAHDDRARGAGQKRAKMLASVPTLALA